MTMMRPQNKVNVKLDAIAKNLVQYQPSISGSTDITVMGISMNSKTVQAGDLYAAVAGAHHHGADYLDQALLAGAVAVLTDARGLERVPRDVPAIVVEDVRGALAEAAAVIYDNIASTPPQMYGVTGTNGKTTTTYFVNALLAAIGETTGLIGTIETRIAGRSVSSQFTTPEAPDLHSLMALMRESSVTAAAMEVSSHAMAYKRTFGLRYGVAGFTNLTQDHLDLHGTMEHYFASKALLFNDDHSTNQVVTVNGGAEPAWGMKLSQQLANPVTLDLGPAAVVDIDVPDTTWKIIEVEAVGIGHRFTLQHESGYKVATRVDMPGKFNVANAALAAVMVYTGHDRQDWDVITETLSVAEHAPFESAVPGRMEVLSKQPTVIVDFAHNPDGLTQALQAVNRSRDQDDEAGRTILVFGATGQRDTVKRPLMGRIAAEYADVVIVTDDDPHYEEPAQIRKPVIEGAASYVKANGTDTQILEIAPRAKALAYAVEIASRHDTILAAGRGHETHQDIAGEPFEIDDREVLRHHLVDHGFITTGAASAELTD
ncbi:MAG: UDP-N-acetylmuramoyl-L-alanyl-D-glutamate--2,6-diaminopimelate ligase [Yaniella sp.]|uniref:UDP-N-acetylmuramoyl-L-alanyl-D-glutamate--2, 6-diaminopimelate ligase n=1 Tax=Yaniella sp. TaxID=2773929 RepID=UPI003F955E3A